MLQNRINELNSAILNIVGEKVYITGFTREEMLNRYLEKDSECWSSQGMYDYQEMKFRNIKNHALIIVRKDGDEISRHQYKPVHKETVQFKEVRNGKNQLVSLTFTIRKSTYSDHYHFSTEKESLLFDTKEDLNEFLLEKFGVTTQI